MQQQQKFDYAQFRKDLKTKRVVELNLGLRPVAEEMGFHATTLSRIENGIIGVDLEKFVKACNWLGVSICDYFYTAKTKSNAKRRK